MAERTSQAVATPPEATPASGHPDTRAETLVAAPDPMLAAFSSAPPEPRPTEDVAPPADDATPSPAAGERPAPRRQPEPSEPSGPSTPDFDTASPDELRQWARQHPSMSKALGLEIREGLQRQNARLQQEQQARQVAEQQAAQAREQSQKVGQYYEAYYDEDNPLHWEATKFFAQQGVQPVEVSKVLNSPVVQQHVSAYAQQVAGAAYEQATTEAIQAAAQHPLLKSLGEQALEDAWQASDATVPGFYTEALKAAGWLDPGQAAEYRKAAQEEARTKAFGDYPPADGSVVLAGSGRATTRRLPANPEQIDPTEWFTRGFSRKNGSD